MVPPGLLQVRIVLAPFQGRNPGCVGSSGWYLGGPLRTCPCSRRIALFPEQGDQPPLQKRPLARAFHTHVSQVLLLLGSRHYIPDLMLDTGSLARHGKIKGL